jgi:hypothetical protein
MMMNRSSLTLGQLSVKDGTSNTLMFGEALGGTGIGGRNHAFTWMGCGALPTAWGLGRANREPLDHGGADWYRFSSRHTAVVQFCFGDGSVRGICRGTSTTLFTPDWHVLCSLSGVNDGQWYNVDCLVD